MNFKVAIIKIEENDIVTVINEVKIINSISISFPPIS
jgi:hypothetical protein